MEIWILVDLLRTAIGHMDLLFPANLCFVRIVTNGWSDWKNGSMDINGFAHSSNIHYGFAIYCQSKILFVLLRTVTTSYKPFVLLRTEFKTQHQNERKMLWMLRTASGMIP